jgi:hypothetical protein
MAKKKKSALEQFNAAFGFRSRRVAEACKIDVAGFQRIERGDVLPKRDTARIIHKLYNGAVPLGVIYDAAHPESLEWFKKSSSDAKSITRANLLAHKRPELLTRRLDAKRRR